MNYECLSREELVQNLMQARYRITELEKQNMNLIQAGCQPLNANLEASGLFDQDLSYLEEAIASHSPSMRHLILYERNRRQQAEEALRLSEEKFSKAFYSSPDPIAIATCREGRYIDINNAFENNFGYARHEALGQTGCDLGIWLGWEEWRHVNKLIKNHGRISNYEARLRIKLGEIRTYLLSAELINVFNEQHILYTGKDITERKKMEEALRLSEERFSKAFNASPVAMSLTSTRDGKIIGVNESACKMFGYSFEEIFSLSTVDIGMWMNADDRERIKLAVINEESIRDMERPFVTKKGEERLALYSGEIVEINNERCVLSIITDITEKKKAEAEIRYLSFHDKLTGLYNRAYFEAEMKRMNQEKQLPVSIIIGDVNGLKTINDALGHMEGDKLLRKIAEILQNAARQEDVVARWGGDEFIILLPRCSREAGQQIYEKICQGMKSINDLPIQASIALGLACKETIRQRMSKVIKEAEEKMYRNKLLESRSARSTFVKSLQETLWTRSCETEEHCQRMQDMARMIGPAIDLPESEMANLILLAALHDIGKIAIPNNILDKPASLSFEEFEQVKKHPEIGYRIARSSPEMVPIAEAILHHHERWDGSGYPLGSQGENIPLIARAVSIIDTYDVIIKGRPYQKPLNQQEAWQEIERCAGSQFDPVLVQKIKAVFSMNDDGVCKMEMLP